MSLDPSTMSRDELVEEIEALKEDRDVLEARLEAQSRTLDNIKAALVGREDDFYQFEFDAENNLLERLELLERGESDGPPGDVDLESMLPIERWAVARRSGDTLSANIERATYVWEALPEFAKREHGLMKVTSDIVENVLTRWSDGPEMSEINRNTRVRVMKMVARGSGPADEVRDPENIVKLVEATNRKMLVANVDEWNQYHTPDDSVSPEDGPDEGALAEADAELDQLVGATAVTDESSDSIEAVIENGDLTPKQVLRELEQRSDEEDTVTLS